jgi:hypothetical protein
VHVLRYAVALVVVDFLVAVVQMQQAIIERASFKPPSVTTFGQYLVTMTSKTGDDVDLYVRIRKATWGDTTRCSPARSRCSTTPSRESPIRRPPASTS